MFRIGRILVAVSLLLVACDEKKTAPPADETVAQTIGAPTAEEAEEAAEPEEDAAGQWVTSDAYEVKFRVADDWQIKTEADSMSATSPDGTISVLLVGTESEGLLQAALGSIKKRVAFKDVNLTKDSQTVVNGMPGYTAQGSAVLVKDGGDQEIEFLMNSVRVGEKGVAMMIFAEAEMYEARKEEVDGIARTLQKK